MHLKWLMIKSTILFAILMKPITQNLGFLKTGTAFIAINISIKDSF